MKATVFIGTFLALALAGCGGSGGSGNGGLTVSGVAGAYSGSYTTSNGGSGTLTVTIGPTGAVNADLQNAGLTVIGTIAGTLSNGGGFVGTGHNTVKSNGTTTSTSYKEKGAFFEQTTGGLTATITATPTGGTLAPYTTYMTLSFG